MIYYQYVALACAAADSRSNKSLDSTLAIVRAPQGQGGRFHCWQEYIRTSNYDTPWLPWGVIISLELQADRVAVEIHLKIIDRGEFDRYVLHENDRIEILSFIGGGSPSHYSKTGTNEGQTLCAQSVSQTYQT